jgi:toxin ParE1/3/4
MHSRVAQQEIAEALRYVASETADPAADDLLLQQLLTAFDLIAAMPRLGRPRSRYGRGLRSHVVGSHTVFYRPHPQYVEITRVIHHRRDLSRAFAKPRRKKIKLTLEFEQAVWERVDSGQYASTDAVLSACIDALAEKEAHAVDALRREISDRHRPDRARRRRRRAGSSRAHSAEAAC